MVWAAWPPARKKIIGLSLFFALVKVTSVLLYFLSQPSRSQATDPALTFDREIKINERNKKFNKLVITSDEKDDDELKKKNSTEKKSYSRKKFIKNNFC